MGLHPRDIAHLIAMLRRLRDHRYPVRVRRARPGGRTLPIEPPIGDVVHPGCPAAVTKPRGSRPASDSSPFRLRPPGEGSEIESEAGTGRSRSRRRLPAMTNAATLVAIQPWVSWSRRHSGGRCASIPASASVPCGDTRPIRGRLDAGAPPSLRSAGAVVTVGWPRRCRCSHARAAALARPDIEAQPARPSMRRHRAVLAHLG